MQEIQQTVNISEDIARLHLMGLLHQLLKDNTTGRNILWASDGYSQLGNGYHAGDEINETLITGQHADIIKTRASKSKEQQTKRTKKHAEVFTPIRVIKEMVDHADKECFAKAGDWQEYVDAKCLEITCGEAPFITTRYDTETAEYIPCAERVGVFDRKMHVVNANAKDEHTWLGWTLRALEASYGYELQGDNLLIARINMLMSIAEYYAEQFKQELWQQHAEVLGKLIRVITWNIWQMNGLTGKTPDTANEQGTLCFVRDHRTHSIVPFNSIGESNPK